MKESKCFAIIYVVIFLAFSIIFFTGEVNVVINNSNESFDNNAELTFSVLGDVHGNTGKLRKAIIDMHNINGKMDAMILNGDNVDQATQIQYDGLKSTLDKNKKLLPGIIIKNIGNHEYLDYRKSPNTAQAEAHFRKLYYGFSGEKSVYHDKWINGYHFISLGSESGNVKGLGPVKATLSNDQLKWLGTKLGEKYEKGKPIFVFLHQHLDTSIKGWVGVVQRKELIDILSKYPEVILFTSHTHVLLSIDNVKLNQPFTTVHTGAVSYGILPEGYKVKRLYDESQGLYIEVKGNKTVIKGRDFAKGTWVFSEEISN